jgi:predicted glycosyltransferase
MCYRWIRAVYTNTGFFARRVVQDLTYTADAAGPGGTAITIAYTGGGTAGAEVVSVVGNAISVQIESGVSTATQVKTAVDASAPASALISVAITGTAGTAQVTAAAAALAQVGVSTINVNMMALSV